MKNEYEIRGNVTAIFLKRKNGVTLECIIDSDDLSIAKNFPNTWYASENKKTNAIYVVGNETDENNKKKTVKLSRKILGVNRSQDFVCFLDNNPLNIRRSNMVILRDMF